MGLNLNWKQTANLGVEINGTGMGNGDTSLWLFKLDSNGTRTAAKTHQDCFECGPTGPVETMGNQSEMGVHELDSLYHSGDELYKVPLSIIIFMSILYGGVSFAALVGNSLVLWIVTVSFRSVINLLFRP